MKRTMLQNTTNPLALPGAFSFVPISTDSTARAMANANEAVYVPIVGAGTFSSVAVRVAVQSGNVCVGVYADTVVSGVHQPGARVATSGSVACPATTAGQTIALDGSVTVTHRSHWFAFAADNTTATFIVQMTFPTVDANLFAGVCYGQTTAFPLPNPAASLTAADKRIPLLRGV